MLGRLAELALFAPRRVLAVTTLLCLLLAGVAVTSPVDTSFLSVLPTDDPLVVRYLAMDDVVGLSRRVALLLEGPPDRLPDAVEQAEEILGASPEIEWVLVDGEGRPEAQVIFASLHDDTLRISAQDIVAGRTSYSVVDRQLTEALSDSGITLGWAGVPAQTIQDQELTLGRFSWLSPLALLGVLLVLRGAEKRPLRLLLIGAPLVLAVVATVGVAAIVFGNISFNEGFFAVVVCGLGADFALHLTLRMREERGAGASFAEALPRTLQGAGPAIVAGGITTAGAFAVMTLAPETLPRRVGLTGAVGLVICLGLMLTWLPAAWALADRGWGRDLGRMGGARIIGKLASFSAMRPVLVVVAAVVVIGVAVAGLHRLRLETDYDNISNRNMDAARVNERMQALFGTNSAPWVVASETLDEARAVRDAFAADPHFERVHGAADLLPPGAQTLPPATPPGVAAQVQGRDGRWLTWAYTGYSGLDTVVLAADRHRAEAIAPGVAGFGMFVEAVVAGDRPWAKWTALGVLALVVAIALVDQRSARWALLALIPAVVGMAVTFGVLCWLGIGFGIAQVFSIPLLLGLGVDDGLHVVHRIRGAPELSVDRAAVSVGRAIVITTATTCVSFMALVFSNNPSLEAMALVILIGLPLCLLTSVTLLPALAVILGGRRPGVRSENPPGSARAARRPRIR